MKINSAGRSTRIAEAALLLITIIWGSSFVVAHYAMEDGLTPLFMLMCRFILSTLFMGGIYFGRIRRELRVRHLKSGFLLGVIFLLSFYTQIVGLKYSTPSNNAIITSSNVVIVPLLWWLLSRQRPSRVVFLSCAISFVGIAVISMDFSQGLTLRVGDLFSVLSAVLFAAQIVAVTRMARQIDYSVLVFLEFGFAALLATALFLLTDGDFRFLSNRTGMLAVLYLSVFCTCFCFLLQAWALRRVNSSRGAVIMSTEALFGSILSIAVGSDLFTWRIVAGGLMLFVSVILPELAQPKTASHISGGD